MAQGCKQPGRSQAEVVMGRSGVFHPNCPNFRHDRLEEPETVRASGFSSCVCFISCLFPLLCFSDGIPLD